MSEPLRICSRRHCGEPSIGKNEVGDELCLDHMTDWEIEQSLFYSDPDEEERAAFLRMARVQ
jgi:hypothetical protein